MLSFAALPNQYVEITALTTASITCSDLLNSKNQSLIMDQPAFLLEEKKSAGLVFTPFTILMAVESCDIQKKASFVI